MFGIAPALATAGVGIAPGYDILLPYGQSNVPYSTTAKDPAIDVADADIYQWGYNAPNADTIIAGNDPLDYVDTSNRSGDAGNGGVGDTIGHAMTFARNTYKPTYAAGRKIMLAGYAYGGKGISNGDVLSANVPGAGYTSFITRALAAQTAGADSSDFKAIIFHQGEADYQAYGNVAQPVIIDAYRACLTYLVDQCRTDLSVIDLPFILGQMTEWSIDAGSARFSTNGINIDRIHRELVNRIEYTGVASNGGTGTGNVHYSAAEQRTLGGAHATSYAAALTNTRPAVAWPSIDVPPAGFVVSGSNMDISGDGTAAWKTAIANGGRRGEMVYAEIEALAVASTVNLGFCGITNCFIAASTEYIGQASGNLTSAGTPATKKAAAVWPGLDQSAVGWTQANAPGLTGMTAGQRLRIELNGITGNAWIGKVGSAWPNGGDPATGANPWITGIGANERVFLAVSIYTGSGNTWRLHADAGDFSGSPDAGYSAWGTP